MRTPSSTSLTVLGAGLIFFLAFGLRLYLAKGLAGPVDNDSSDYYLVARNLFQGRGFVEEVVGYFQPAPAAVLHPSHDHWMPLASILVYLSLLAFGDSFAAAQIPNVLLGAAIPVVGVAVALEMGARRKYALLGGILMAAVPRMVMYSAGTEAVVPYAFFGGLAFLGAVKGAAGKPAWLALAGAAAGLCYLSRNDGSLWVPAFIGVYLLGLRDRSQPQGRFRHWVWAAAGFLLVTAPWLARNYAVFGSLFPPGMAQVMFYRDYTDVYNYEQVASLHTYLAQGAAVILKSKAFALAVVLFNLGQDGAIYWVLLPPAVLGMVLAPPLARRVILAHLAIVVVVWALLMDVLAGPFGGTKRTMMLLSMYLVPTAMLGLDWIEQRGRKYFPFTPWILPGLLLLFFFMLATFLWKSKEKLDQTCQAEWDYYHQLGQFLKQTSSGRPVVMSFRPWQLNLAEGLPTVSVPADGLSAILAAGHKYGVDFLVWEDYWIRDQLGYRAQTAYFKNLAREFQETGKNRDPDFTFAGSHGETLIFRLPSGAGTEGTAAP